MRTITSSSEWDTQECEHCERDYLIGLGVGFFERCKDCGAEFVRISIGPGEEDWEYQELQRGGGAE